MLAYHSLHKNKDKDGNSRPTPRVKFVDACMYFTSIPKFGLVPVGNVRDIGTTAAPASGNGGDSVPTAAVETCPVYRGSGGQSGGLMETEGLAECETGSSSLRNVPVGLATWPTSMKRKAAMNEAKVDRGTSICAPVHFGKRCIFYGEGN
jgi:hypothetical protein